MEFKDYYEKTKRDAAVGGYILNTDAESVIALCEGLYTNIERYGYAACPCRRAKGLKADDNDIICPCDYRDSDLELYGACYCGLYISKEVADGTKELESIPESRPTAEERKLRFGKAILTGGLPLPVWRCKVCGYLCAREAPPAICPICKVDKERFEQFL